MITVHAGKCYKALINSGATISLLRYSAYKNIEDYYKTPIQPTRAKLNTADGSPMTPLGMTALQFWTADLKAHILGSTIDKVFHAFFYSTSTHILCQQSDEILFGHFVTTLNATFESKLASEDEGYKSISESFNILTLL